MLDNRLDAVAKYVTPMSRVVDVGTDHALLPIYLIKNNITDKVIGIEVNEGPYQKAREKVSSMGLDDRIKILRGDGLEPIADCLVDIVVIAGLGSRTIVDILKKGAKTLENTKRLIFQPMNKSDILRHYLINQGWYLFDEELILENNRLYEVIVAEPGQSQEIEDMLVEIGPVLFKKRHELLPLLLEEKMKRYIKIADDLEKSSDFVSQQKIRYYLSKAKKIEKVLVSCL